MWNKSPGAVWVSAGAAVILLLTAAAPLPQTSAASSAGPPRPEHFPNILPMTGRPASATDWPASRFSDLGSWFGYTLPPGADVALRGGFVGPFLMNEGAWAGLTLAQLQLEDDVGRDLSLETAGEVELTAFPGRLHQRLQTDSFTVTLDLIIVSGRSVVVRAEVKNIGSQPRRVGVGWRGESLDGAGVFTTLHGEVRVQTAAGGSVSVIPLTPGTARPLLPAAGGAFRIRPVAPARLAPGESTHSYLAHLVSAAGEPETAERRALDDLARAPAQAFAANERRWSGYLEPVLRLDPAFATSPAYRVTAVKALMTLLGNWRRPLGDLRHAGLVPSSGVRYFNGFWAWDSWKHAVALARILPDLAQDQIRAMFDHQDADGMVADCVYADRKENNWLNSKPPLAAWAVLEVYRQTGDRGFLHEMLPQLRRYHEWWSRKRDRDQDGLCEYGATAERLDAAKWESGMDNAVRFDEATLRKLDDHAWTLNQESVDLNAYLYAEKRYLAEIMRALLKDPDPALGVSAGRLQAAIRAWMYDAQTGYFHDVDAVTGAKVRAQGPEGWIPLWAGVATHGQAEAVRRALIDGRKFATHVPFPTLAADHPKLESKGYWRGPVWLDQAYFAVEGLRRYGFADDALRLTRQLIDRAEGLTTPGIPIRENYDPLTGEGLEAPDFSWSAAHVLLLMWGEGPVAPTAPAPVRRK